MISIARQQRFHDLMRRRAPYGIYLKHSTRPANQSRSQTSVHRRKTHFGLVPEYGDEGVKLEQQLLVADTGTELLSNFPFEEALLET